MEVLGRTTSVETIEQIGAVGGPRHAKCLGNRFDRCSIKPTRIRATFNSFVIDAHLSTQAPRHEFGLQ